MSIYKEIWQVVRANWFIVAFAIVVFASIFAIYPFTDMGKQQAMEKELQIIERYGVETYLEATP